TMTATKTATPGASFAPRDFWPLARAAWRVQFRRYASDATQAAWWQAALLEPETVQQALEKLFFTDRQPCELAALAKWLLLPRVWPEVTTIMRQIVPEIIHRTTGNDEKALQRIGGKES